MKKLILLISAALSMHAHATLLDDLKSPVTTDAKWILISGTAVTLASFINRSGIEKPFETYTVQHRTLGKFDKVGDLSGQLVPNALYIGGTLLAYELGNPFGYYRAKLMFESTLYAAVVATIFKYTVREGRPYDNDVRNSFPRATVRRVFAFAGAVAAEHGWWWGVPAMALATFTAYSRIDDNQHHVHDVLAGATIGLTCAYGVYYAQKPEREKLGDIASIMPMALPGGAGLSATWIF